MESSNIYELQQQQQLGRFKVSDRSNPNLPLNKDEYEHYMNEILPMSAQLITNNEDINYFGGGDDDEYEIRCPSFYNNSSLVQNTLVNLNQNVCKNQLLIFPVNNYVLDSTVMTSSSSNSGLPNLFNNCTPSSSSHNQIHHHHHHHHHESTTSNKTSACKDKAISRTKRVYNSSKKEAATKKQRAATHQSSCSLPKVVKEKIGDRIAALHRLVAPFGKTDSASVLTEAIGYIHFLHHQIQTLSMPCIKPSQSINRLRCFQQVSGEEKGKQVDLKSRGFSVVPISVAAYVSSSFVGFD